MSFGPIKHRMRRPIPSVTEQRGGGHAIELSHVRPDRQAPAVIGTTIGGHARRNRPVRSAGAFIVEGSRLDSLPIRRSRNRSGPSSPSRSRQRLNGRSNTPATPPFPPRQLAPLMPPAAALRNASAVPLAAPPPGPFPTPFSDALKPDHALPEPNSSRVAALSVPRTCRSKRRPCSRASASILAAANGVIDWVSAISKTCLSFSLNKPTLVLTFCLS